MNAALFRKTVSILLLVFLLTPLSYGQQGPQAIFDTGNEQLENGNYREALTTYKQLTNQNRISGALYLNMGIAYHRLDSLGYAKYYFLKASRFDETEERAETALTNLESQFSRQSAVLPKLPWDRATDWLRLNIGATNLMVVGIILLNISIFVYISHWFGYWRPNILRTTGLSLLIAALLVISTSFYTDYVSNRYSGAVMITQKTSVFEQSDSEAPLISQAYECYSFTVDHYRSDSQPGWVYVRLSNGQYGWIPKSEILIL